MAKKIPVETPESVVAKQAQDLDRFIKESLREIRVAANLGNYEVGYKFSAKKKIHGNRSVLAEIGVDTRYLRANMILRPELVELYKNKQYEEIKKTLCHELAHIETEKLAQLACHRFTSAEDIHSELETLTEKFGRLLYFKTYENNARTKPKQPAVNGEPAKSV